MEQKQKKKTVQRPVNDLLINDLLIVRWKCLEVHSRWQSAPFLWSRRIRWPRSPHCWSLLESRKFTYGSDSVQPYDMCYMTLLYIHFRSFICTHLLTFTHNSLIYSSYSNTICSNNKSYICVLLTLFSFHVKVELTYRRIIFCRYRGAAS